MSIENPRSNSLDDQAPSLPGNSIDDVEDLDKLEEQFDADEESLNSPDPEVAWDRLGQEMEDELSTAELPKPWVSPSEPEPKEEADSGITFVEASEPETATTTPETPPAPPAEESQKPTLPEIKFQFPNATAGKSYRAKVLPQFTPVGSNMRLLADLDVELAGFEGLGIDYEVSEDNVELFGTPTQDGEFNITVRYTVPRQGNHPVIDKETTATFLINPDPRSLWKNLEPDQTLPYQKSHEDKVRIAQKSVMLAASRRGRSHAHEGTFRDDDFRLEYDAGSGWYLMAVSDGAGSARFSRRGSEIACDVVCEQIARHLTSTLGDNFEKMLADHVVDRDEASRKQIRNSLYSSLGGAAMAAFKRSRRKLKDATALN